MTTRPYEELAAPARASWGPQAREISERLGQQLDLETGDPEVLGRELRGHSPSVQASCWRSIAQVSSQLKSGSGSSTPIMALV